MERKKPDVDALLDVLNKHGVDYLVTGSGAAMLHGVVLEPGDLDITPALGRDNLVRLARALKAIHARQYEDAAFGHWETNATGEHQWVRDEPTLERVAARASWVPNPDEPETFDYLLDSDHGSIDIVPTISGTYVELAPRATNLPKGRHIVLLEAVSDLLATLTVPRRDKDAERVRQLRSIQRSETTVSSRSSKTRRLG